MLRNLISEIVRPAALVLAMLAGAFPAAAQVTLTVTSQLGPDKPQSQFWVRFAAVVEAARPGAYSFNIVTNGALGGEKEEAESVRLGAITGALSTAANLTTWVPEGAVLDVPFLFATKAHIGRVLSGEVGETLKAKYRAAGFETPSFIDFGPRHLIARRPLPRPGDLRGLTIRSLQSDLHVSFWRYLGANPTALPITEAYTALASGVVDAMDFTMSGYEGLKLYEVAPVLTETSHIEALGVVYFDPQFWAELPDADRALFQRAAEEAADHFDALVVTDNTAAMERALSRGAEAVAVDQEIWLTTLAPFAEEFVARLGGDAPELLDAIRAAR